MAVYQISKIQIRRGKARTGPGFPQLASGELGWAIDSQELYIGNGSVSEGAPSIGNTKILTSRDLTSTGSGGSGLITILEHTYKSNDASITTGANNTSISRTLQSVLDDTVNVYDFGAIGDGTADDTDAIQRAIDQLFANPNIKSFENTISGIQQRVTLKMPSGIFKTTNSITVPSYATIIGAGIDKTIIQYTGTGTAVRCISDNDSTYLIINPRYIYIEGLTINTVNEHATGIDIANTSTSKFENIKLIGSWSGQPTLDSKGVNINNVSEVTANNLIFNNITVSNFCYGVYAGNASTQIIFNVGSILSSYIGFAVGLNLTNTSNGPTNFHVNDYTFTNITMQAYISNIGSNNSITNCNLFNVGGENTSPTMTQIYFAQPGNYVNNIQSNRSSLTNPESTVKYIPEVSGYSIFDSKPITSDIIVSENPVDLFRLPLRTNSNSEVSGVISYIIKYSFNGLFTKQGQISITTAPPTIDSSEEYTCSGTTSDAILLDFTVSIANNTLVISYTNTLTNNAGSLTYSYTAIS